MLTHPHTLALKIKLTSQKFDTLDFVHVPGHRLKMLPCTDIVTMQYNTFMMPVQGKEWMIHNADDATKMIVDTIQCNKDTQRGDISILIPGAGISEIAPALHQCGYTQLTITDIEKDSVVEQTQLCQDCYPAPRILHSNILTHNIQESFDVIIDKGLIDVFIKAKNVNTVLAWEKLTSLLKEDGLIISFSIHFQEWFDIISSDAWNTLHSTYVFRRTGTKTRPNAGHPPQTISYFARKRVSQTMPQHIDLSNGMRLTRLASSS